MHVAPHSPEVHILSFDGTSPHSLTWGEIQEFVAEAFANFGIAIGLIERNEMGTVTLAPSPMEKVLPSDHRIIVMVRRRAPSAASIDPSAPERLRRASLLLEKGTALPAIFMHG